MTKNREKNDLKNLVNFQIDPIWNFFFSPGMWAFIFFCF